MRWVISYLLLISFSFYEQIPDPERFRNNPFGDKTSIDLFRLWDKKNSVPENPIVFIGSSSIRKWPTTKYFPDMPIINRGFGGSHISDVNYFIDETVLKYKPNIIVFYAGDNDIAFGKTPEIVLNDYIFFIKKVHSLFPLTKIYFLPIKPSVKRWSFWPDMERTNQLIKSYSNNNPFLFYVDTATPMLGNDGIPKGSLFVSDSLHLNNKGYDIWSEILGPILRAASE